MGRFEDTETAVAKKLLALKLKHEMTINLFDIGIPLNAAGFSQDEILAVLVALEQDKIIEFSPGNRLRLLKPLP